MEAVRGRNGLPELLKSGIEPRTIRDRLLALDWEEREGKSEPAVVPNLEIVDPSVSAPEYRILVKGIIDESASSYGLREKQEVRTAIRRIVGEVVIYSADDAKGRDIEFVGDIQPLTFGGDYQIKSLKPDLISRAFVFPVYINATSTPDQKNSTSTYKRAATCSGNATRSIPVPVTAMSRLSLCIWPREKSRGSIVP